MVKIGSIKLMCCTSTTHFQLWFLSGWPLNVPVVCLEGSMYTLLQEYEVLIISGDELVTQSLYRSFQLSQFNTRNVASHINSHCTRIPAYLDDVRHVSWWRQTPIVMTSDPKVEAWDRHEHYMFRIIVLMLCSMLTSLCSMLAWRSWTVLRISSRANCVSTACQR